VGLAAGAHCGGGLFLEGWSVAPAFRAYHEERCAEVAVLGSEKSLHGTCSWNLTLATKGAAIMESRVRC
jgi:hypothetical protein